MGHVRRSRLLYKFFSMTYNDSVSYLTSLCRRTAENYVYNIGIHQNCIGTSVSFMLHILVERYD